MIGAYDYRDSLAKPQHSSVRKAGGPGLEIVHVLDHVDYSVEGELSKAEDRL